MLFPYIILFAGGFSTSPITLALPTNQDASLRESKQSTSAAPQVAASSGVFQSAPTLTSTRSTENPTSQNSEIGGTQTGDEPTENNSEYSNENLIKAGNYNIIFCGNQSTPVREALQVLWETLPGVENDASTGDESAAFQTFFKTATYAPFVQKMLSNITNGASLLKPNQTVASGPTFACLTGPGEAMEQTPAGTKDVFEICSGNPKYAAFYRSSTNWIFLCPEFFATQQQASPPANQYCPDVDDNYFVLSNWIHLVQTQMFLLMHEILHFYLDSAPYPATDSVSEVTDINVAYNLAGADAISNAESYVIYAAMVAAGCKNYPVATDLDPDQCSGTCLETLGAPASDVISMAGNLTIDSIPMDTNYASNITAGNSEALAARSEDDE